MDNTLSWPVIPQPNAGSATPCSRRQIGRPLVQACVAALTGWPGGVQSPPAQIGESSPNRPRPPERYHPGSSRSGLGQRGIGLESRHPYSTIVVFRQLCRFLVLSRCATRKVMESGTSLTTIGLGWAPRSGKECRSPWRDTNTVGKGVAGRGDDEAAVVRGISEPIDIGHEVLSSRW
jgi:hypothetical protein